MVGAGTALNIATVITGGLLGLAVRHRLSPHPVKVATEVIGLVTLLMAALTAASVTSAPLKEAVGQGAPVLVLLGSLLIGGLVGAWLRVEDRIEALGRRLEALTRRGGPSSEPGEEPGGEPSPFVQGFLTASLLFCVGPMTILGSLQDGLGQGIELLALKSVLDGFASIAFAATMGVGVLAAAGTVLVVQGGFTALGVLAGEFLPTAQIDMISATGGVILFGLGLRILELRRFSVADMLPALLVAPVLVEVISRLR